MTRPHRKAIELLGVKTGARKSASTAASAWPACRCFAFAVLLLLFLTGAAAAESAVPDPLPRTGEIISNPQAAYTFAGWDQLGVALGVPEDLGLRLGGFFISEFNHIASGGVDPDTTLANLALGLHASLDTNKAFCIPGGTLGIELLEFTGGAVNDSAGSVQLLTTMDGPPPRTRHELMQLWWRQSLFDNRLIFHIGKMNGSGTFGNLQVPVIIGDRQLQDGDITNLIFVPVGLNPTLFGRLPSYYNTGYGAVVHIAPTESLYFSYGLYDANAIRGVQTGIECLPTLNSYKLHIGEAGYSWRVGERRKPGRVGIGGWYQTGELYAPDLTTEDGAAGFYLFAHQRLWYKHPDIDNAGIIGYFQLAHTDSHTQAVNTYLGSGLTALRMVPGRPADQFSLGIAWSWLNDKPGAGSFFFPDVVSRSKDLGESEFMMQFVYQTTFFFKLPRGFWSLSPVIGYTHIPSPGQRPDLPAANVISLRLITLF
ncbi:MAG: carbohydrate porin [Syntrophobacteraceae bacterium]|nr:carbohydrate porin [Syntrophobacteraceae bacterium]